MNLKTKQCTRPLHHIDFKSSQDIQRSLAKCNLIETNIQMASKHVSGTQIVPRVTGPSMSFWDEANNQGILTDVNQVMGCMNRRYSCAYFTNKVSDFLWKDAHMLSFLVILKEAQRLPRLFLVFAIQQPLTPVHLSIHSFHVCLLLDQHTAGPVYRLGFLLSLTGILLRPHSIHVSVKHKCSHVDHPDRN